MVHACTITVKLWEKHFVYTSTQGISAITALGLMLVIKKTFNVGKNKLKVLWVPKPKGRGYPGGYLMNNTKLSCHSGVDLALKLCNLIHLESRSHLSGNETQIWVQLGLAVAVVRRAPTASATVVLFHRWTWQLLSSTGEGS